MEKIQEKKFVMDLTLGYGNLLQETDGTETIKYLWDSAPLAVKDGRVGRDAFGRDL